jgi:flagellar motor switch protein FliM
MRHPTCLAVAAMSPLDSKLLLEMPCGVTFPLLERLLGGQPRAQTIPERPLTDLELRVMGHLLDIILATWTASWQSIVACHIGLERIESNPRVVRCLPAVEPILVANFSLTWSEVQGQFRLALPVRVAVDACSSRPLVARGMPGGERSLTADTGRARKHRTDITADTLPVGETERDPANLARGEVGVDGHPRYRGTYLVLQGRRTMRTDPLTGRE